MSFENGPRQKQVHEFRVYREILPLIESGEKTHEVRVAYPIFKKIQVGDIIDFGNGVKKTVVAIQSFESPDACINTLGANAFLPGQSEDDLLKIWDTRIDPKGNYKKHGILAFKLT